MWLDISSPTEHLGVLKKSSKRVRAFQIEMEFGSVYFWGEGKPKYTEKNLSEQGRESTTNSTHIRVWRRRQDSNPDHIGGRRVLSPLSHSPFLLVLEQSTALYPLLSLSFKLATGRVKSGCQRKPGKMLKMSTDVGQQNKFILTS